MFSIIKPSLSVGRKGGKLNSGSAIFVSVFLIVSSFGIFLVV